MAKPQPLIHAPSCYSIVEPGVYRCASPSAAEVPFLATLGLRTIISLTAEHPTRQLVDYAQSAGIDFVNLGTSLFQILGDWQPISDDIVKAALELILDVRCHPVLVVDPLGIHQTGIVIGCLRVMQGWNFASTLSEYRSHSGPAKHRYSDETYIELFDPDIVNLPPVQCLPAWWDEAVEEDEWVEVDIKVKEKKKKKDKDGKDKDGKDKDKEKEKSKDKGKEGKEKTEKTEEKERTEGAHRDNEAD